MIQRAPLASAQPRSSSAAASTSSSSKRPLRRPACTAGSQPPSPSRASARPSSARTSSASLRIAPSSSGSHLLDLEDERLGAQVQRRRPHQLGRRRLAEARPGAHGAAPAVLRIGVVELLLQRAHEAAPVGAEAGHRRLLGAPQRGDLGVALGVVGPVRVGAPHPRRAPPLHRALDVEDLQHRLDPPAPEVDVGEDRRAASPRPRRRAPPGPARPSRAAGRPAR